MTSVRSRWRGVGGDDRVPKHRLAAVEVHLVLPIDLEVDGFLQRLAFQVAVHEPFHAAGAVDPEMVVAAIEVQVRAGQRQAAALEVGRPAEHADRAVGAVGVADLQPVARQQQRLLAGQGRFGLDEADVVFHGQCREVGLFSVRREQDLGAHQAAGDFHVLLPRRRCAAGLPGGNVLARPRRSRPRSGQRRGRGDRRGGRRLEPRLQLIDDGGELRRIELHPAAGEHPIRLQLRLPRRRLRRLQQPEVDLVGSQLIDRLKSQLGAAGERDHLLPLLRLDPQAVAPAGLESADRPARPSGGEASRVPGPRRAPSVPARPIRSGRCGRGSRRRRGGARLRARRSG